MQASSETGQEVAVGNSTEVAITAIAEEIRTEHEACERDAQSAVHHAIRAGELLIKAKRQVEHGQWLLWLQENFPGTQQTANAYMRISEKYGRSRNLPVSINAALKQLQPGKYICTGCQTERSATQFDPRSDRCNVCIAREITAEPATTKPVKTYEPNTERKKQIADKAKEDLFSRIVFRSPTVELLEDFPFDAALAVTGKREAGELITRIDEAIRAFGFLRTEIERRVD